MSNKYKKAVKFLGLFLLCAAVITFLYSRAHVEYSVQPEGQNGPVHPDDGEKAAADFPKVYQKKVSDMLNFDVKVVVPEEGVASSIPKATATLVDLDQEKLYEYFMGESSSVKTEDYEGNQDFGGNEYIVHVSEDAEGRYLALGDRIVTFMMDDPMVYIINTFMPYQLVDSYNGDKFSTSDDLAFQDREQAWEAVKDMIEGLGIDMSNAVPYVTYSLDLKTLKAEEKRMVEEFGCMEPEEQNPSWSREAEGYRYYIGQQYQGLPIYEYTKVDVNNPGEFWDGASMDVYQTEAGLMDFQIDRWLQIQEREGAYPLTGFETVMENLEEKYSGIIMTNPLTVEEARLCLFPVQTGKSEFELTPVWICILAEELPDANGGTYIARMQIPMNAVTGEEMPELELK